MFMKLSTSVLVYYIEYPVTVGSDLIQQMFIEHLLCLRHFNDAA